MNNSNNVLIQQALLAAEAKKNQVASVVPQQKYAPKLNEGVYIAVVTDAEYQQNQPTDFGVSDRVCITLSVPHSDKTVEIVSRYWVSKTDDSRYVTHLKALLGQDPRLGFDLNELLGQVVELEIHHFENDKGVFASVSTIKQIEKYQIESNFTI